MNFLKSRKGGAVVLAAAVLFGTFFGSHRSLNAVRSDAWNVFLNGAKGDGHSVSADLETRRGVCENLYTVANRYLPAENPQMGYLRNDLDALGGEEDVFAQTDMAAAAESLLMQLGKLSLSDQDAKYVSGFRTQLESLEFTISHDPYNDMAEEFNDNVLGGFPASLLGTLTGVKELPVYR